MELLKGRLTRNGFKPILAHTDPAQPAGLSGSDFFDVEGSLTGEDLLGLVDATGVGILDVASGEAAAFAEFYERHDIGDLLAEAEATATLVIPVTMSSQSEKCLVRLAEALRADVDYVVVRAEGLGAAATGWAVPNAGRAMHHLDGLEVVLPPLPEALKNEEASGNGRLPQWLSGKAGLPRYLKSALHEWELNCDAAMDRAADFLQPPASMKAHSPSQMPVSSYRVPAEALV